MATVRENQLCLNCMKAGHFKLHCPSNQRCQKCQTLHHTMLHQCSDSPVQTKTGSVVKNRAKEHSPLPTVADTIHHLYLSHQSQHQVLLMTWRILIVSPDGYVTQGRALLDSASCTCTSFVSERLAQWLRLPRKRQHIQVAGIWWHVSGTTLTFHGSLLYHL